MNNKNDQTKFKLLLLKLSSQGFTLTEVLVALVMSSIILVFAAYGSSALFQSENKLNRNSNISTQMSRAIAFIEDDIKSAGSVELQSNGNGDCTTDFAKGDCLKLNYNDGSTVLYGFKDISGINSSDDLYKWLKPGLLRRKVDAEVPVVLIDGLAIDDYDPNNNTPNTITHPTCTLGTTVYNTQGFQFCLGSELAPIQRVQIFLFGYTGNSPEDKPIQLSNLTFAQN